MRVRRTPSGAAILDSAAGTPAEPFDPLERVPTDELEAALAAPQARPPRRVERRRRPLSSRQWKLALATGLLAFLIAAVVVTVSELAIFGDSVSAATASTTFFGGRHATTTPPTIAHGDADGAARRRPEATPTPTPTDQRHARRRARRRRRATPAPLTASPTATATATPAP